MATDPQHTTDTVTFQDGSTKTITYPTGGGIVNESIPTDPINPNTAEDITPTGTPVDTVTQATEFSDNNGNGTNQQSA